MTAHIPDRLHPEIMRYKNIKYIISFKWDPNIADPNAAPLSARIEFNYEPGKLHEITPPTPWQSLDQAKDYAISHAKEVINNLAI